MQIYALGSREVVTALALVGIPGRAVEDKREMTEALEDPDTLHNVRILVVEESVAAMDTDRIARMKLDSSGPLVVEIPGIGGPVEGRRTPLDLVRQALGINL